MSSASISDSQITTVNAMVNRSDTSEDVVNVAVGAGGASSVGDDDVGDVLGAVTDSDCGAFTVDDVNTCGCHGSWEEHAAWVRVVVIHDLLNRDLARRRAPLCIDDVALELTDVMGRPPTESELSDIFQWMDTDGDGFIDTGELRSARWRSSADFVAGWVRATTSAALHATTSVLARTPVVKFFRPRGRTIIDHDVPSASRASGLTARGVFTVGSAIAAAIAFLSQRQVREWLADSQPNESRDDNDSLPSPSVLQSSFTHFVSGGIGGALHAVVMVGVTAGSAVVHSTSMRRLSDAAERARCTSMFGARVAHHLPGLVIKDVIGFAFFFGAYHVVQSALEEWLLWRRKAEQIKDAKSRGPKSPHGPDVNTLARGFTRAEAVGVAAVSGAAAGVCYHAVGYPMDRAHAMARRGASVGQLIATGRAVGARRLYRGFLHSGGLVRSIIIGTVTFASYDAVIRYLAPSESAPRTSRTS